MSNTASLKPFKKGPDPRRYKKQKGVLTFETKFKTFISDWCARKGEVPQDIQDETWEDLRKMAKKDFKALSYFLDRLYGKTTDKVEHSGEIIQKVDDKALESYIVWRRQQKKK